MQVMSWGEFLMIILMALIAWYAFVLLKYYRGIFTRKKSPEKENITWSRRQVSDKPDTPISSSSSEYNTHAQVHELLEEIKLIFTAGLRDQLSKDQIIEALGKRLQKYPTLPAVIKQSITQHIINEFSLQFMRRYEMAIYYRGDPSAVWLFFPGRRAIGNPRTVD